MYLEVWQLIILVCLFGVCAVWNKRQGVLHGVRSSINFLQENDIITVTKEGNICRYKDRFEENV